jgi:putative oxidoreductase
MASLARWGLRAALSLVFFVAGATKFVSPGWTMRFTAWGYPGWCRWAIGALEVVAAVMLLVSPTQKLAIFALLGVMTGAAATHLLNGEATRAVVNVVIAALLIVLQRAPGAGRPGRPSRRRRLDLSSP